MVRWPLKARTDPTNEPNPIYDPNTYPKGRYEATRHTKSKLPPRAVTHDDAAVIPMSYNANRMVEIGDKH